MQGLLLGKVSQQRSILNSCTHTLGAGGRGGGEGGEGGAQHLQHSSGPRVSIPD